MCKSEENGWVCCHCRTPEIGVFCLHASYLCDACGRVRCVSLASTKRPNGRAPSASLVNIARHMLAMTVAEGVDLQRLLDTASKRCRARGPSGTSCILAENHFPMCKNELGQRWSRR